MAVSYPSFKISARPPNLPIAPVLEASLDSFVPPALTPFLTLGAFFSANLLTCLTRFTGCPFRGLTELPSLPYTGFEPLAALVCFSSAAFLLVDLTALEDL